MTSRAARINLLGGLVDAKTYLEIGVQAGRTFRAVNIANKVAVDPKFAFDFSQETSDNCEYWEITSSDYFSGKKGSEPFDVVFLDGLHTFEQTLEDLLAALSVTHVRSLIIVDDTVPSDVYSAIPNMSRAFRHRKSSGIVSSQWHGDVWKVVPFISWLIPNLSYATIAGQGNPQTVIWRESRSEFGEGGTDLNLFSRIDYFWLQENFAIMNPQSFDSIVATLTDRFQ